MLLSTGDKAGARVLSTSSDDGCDVIVTSEKVKEINIKDTYAISMYKDARVIFVS